MEELSRDHNGKLFPAYCVTKDCEGAAELGETRSRRRRSQSIASVVRLWSGLDIDLIDPFGFCCLIIEKPLMECFVPA